MNVTINCDRCGKEVHGVATVTGTSGFYSVGFGSGWATFARPGEEKVCDDCMWDDPRYQATYGNPKRT